MVIRRHESWGATVSYEQILSFHDFWAPGHPSSMSASWWMLSVGAREGRKKCQGPVPVTYVHLSQLSNALSVFSLILFSLSFLLFHFKGQDRANSPRQAEHQRARWGYQFKLSRNTSCTKSCLTDFKRTITGFMPWHVRELLSGQMYEVLVRKGGGLIPMQVKSWPWRWSSHGCESVCSIPSSFIWYSEEHWGSQRHIPGWSDIQEAQPVFLRFYKHRLTDEHNFHPSECLFTPDGDHYQKSTSYQKAENMWPWGTQP